MSLEPMAETEKEFTASFDWSAELNHDGSLVLTYKKLVNNGAIIDKIKVKISPFFYKSSGEEQTVSALKTISSEWIDRTNPTEDKIGIFVVNKIRQRLTELLENTGNTLTTPRPFHAIVVKMRAEINDPNGNNEPVVILNEFDVVPTNDWTYT